MGKLSDGIVDMDLLAIQANLEAAFEPSQPGETLRLLETLIPADESQAPAHVQPSVVLGDVLGKGGMGVVYAARQQPLDRDVAVKTVSRTSNLHHRRMLVAEAQHLGRLEHPNIVPVYLLLETPDGEPQLVMRRVEGWDWSTLMDDEYHEGWDDWQGSEYAPLQRNVELLAQVCRAASFAHRNDVVHCDIKPDNIRVDTEGTVFLMDWGSATTYPTDLKSEYISGTPVFMSPEQALGQQVTPATDVFLLGGCLFRILTGAAPYQSRTVNQAVFHAMVCNPRLYPKGLPAGLTQLAQEMMAREPHQRPTAELARRRLLGWLREQVRDGWLRASEEVLRSLEDFVQEKDHHGAQGAFQQLRAGLAPILKESPDHERAKGQLIDAVSAMLRLELDRNNLDHAQTLLNELAHLGVDIVDLRAELQNLTERHQALEGQRQELDPSVGGKQRQLMYTATLAATVGINVAVIMGLFPSSTPLLLVTYSLMINAVALVGLAVFWRALTVNLTGKTTTAVVAAVLTTTLLNRLFGWFGGLDASQIMGQDLLLISCASPAFALSFGRILAWMGLVCLLAAPLCIVFPQYADQWFCTGCAGFCLALYWASGRHI
jgi:eukaryotic-like serine/threonine-protein kinase